MHIELIDLLRCTNRHEDAHLVAVFHRIENRDVIDADLGCPVCGKTFPVRKGVAVFTPADAKPRGFDSPSLWDENAAIRVAAYLDLTSPGLTVGLAETLEPTFESLVRVTNARIFGLTRRSRDDYPASAAWLQFDEAVPLASHSLDAVALDADFIDLRLVAEAHRVLKPGRRLIAPAAACLEGFREIARDDDLVVAERMPELIQLNR